MSAGTEIHPLALVEKGAQLGAGVRVGPFCHVGPEVVLGDGVHLLSHVSVTGATTVGARTQVHPHAALGGPPQDLKHKDARTTLTVGADCLIREGFTAHRGTEHGGGHTRIGDRCFLMANSHVAHDCHIGNGIIMANGSVMGGHCEIDDNVIISGLVAIHQFVRIGRGAMLGGGARVAGDVIPYGMAQGDRATLRGLNVVGLRRAGASHSDIAALRQAYLMLFDRARPVAENVERVRTAFPGNARVAEVLLFFTAKGRRIFTVPGVDAAAEGGDE
ncbi:MAG: acyl-ACP--UDP-N-acetylglucosamine O-acyltransferase [Rhizobiaceae bacterium]|nr:acyl-ACP--UDP-N-acetylglucosamine O-acyltransferase [Rhizobiaceae bacterium]